MMVFMYAPVGYIQLFQKYTLHSFFYDSYFAQLYRGEWCVAIIDNRSYAHIYVLEEKYRISKTTLNNVLRVFLKEAVLLIMH